MSLSRSNMMNISNGHPIRENYRKTQNISPFSQFSASDAQNSDYKFGKQVSYSHEEYPILGSSCLSKNRISVYRVII